MGNKETDRLKELVQQRRDEAEKLELDKAVVAIYNQFFLFDDWPDHKEKYIPGAFSQVTFREGKPGFDDLESRIVDFHLFGKPFSMQIREYHLEHNDDGVAGEILLFSGSTKVFAVQMFEPYAEYYSEWGPVQVDAFISGDWVDDIRRMYALLLKRRAAAEKDYARSTAVAEAKEFGIDATTLPAPPSTVEHPGKRASQQSPPSTKWAKFWYVVLVALVVGLIRACARGEIS